MADLWLVTVITSYLFFSLAFFADKLVLSGPPNPKLYTFYVGFLGIIAIFLIPFLPLVSPSPMTVFWIILEIIVYVLGLYTMFVALAQFEVSRVMTTIGALQPILILVFSFLFWSEKIISGTNFLAFALLVVGGILISFGKKFKITKYYALLVLFSSLMFSLDYVFSKMIFLDIPFLPAMVIMRIGAALVVLLLLFDRKLRLEIFSKKPAMDKKTGTIFLLGQSVGGVGGVLQSFSIALVPVSSLAIISSLRGTQYVFLFLITLFFSYFFPTTFKEDISLRAILQKSVSIVLIVIGLALLI